MYTKQTSILLAPRISVDITYRIQHSVEESFVQKSIKQHIRQIVQWFDMSTIEPTIFIRAVESIMERLKSDGTLNDYSLVWDWRGIEVNGNRVWFIFHENNKKKYYLSEHNKDQKKSAWSNSVDHALLFNSETLAKKFMRRCQRGTIGSITM